MQPANPSVIHPVLPSSHSHHLQKSRMPMLHNRLLPPGTSDPEREAPHHSHHMKPVMALCGLRQSYMTRGRTGDFVQTAVDEGCHRVADAVRRTAPFWRMRVKA